MGRLRGNTLAPESQSGKKGKEVKVTGKRDLEKKKKLNYFLMLIQKHIKKIKKRERPRSLLRSA